MFLLVTVIFYKMLVAILCYCTQMIYIYFPNKLVHKLYATHPENMCFFRSSRVIFCFNIDGFVLQSIYSFSNLRVLIDSKDIMYILVDRTTSWVPSIWYLQLKGPLYTTMQKLLYKMISSV